MIIINQPNMAVQEDLAAIFQRSLTLDPAPPPPQQEPKIVYISQHYNHSAHISQQPQTQDIPEPTRRSSEPPPSELHDLELLLRQHGVNTSALSAPQVDLFKAADDPQKLRLIQLWTICPPTSTADNPALTWSTTSLQQEEALAKLRYERNQTPDEAMSLDGTSVMVQDGQGKWNAPLHAHHYMEPYMQSGYEELARREYEASSASARDVAYSHATDPVYNATQGSVDWERQQRMENQYGAISAWRDDEEML